MIKILFRTSVILCLFFSSVYADIINQVEIKNNNRISKQTIITYGKVELNKDYNLDEINQILKNLYETNFFESLKIDIVDNKLIIDVKENKIIQEVAVEGIKTKKLTTAILENLFSKDKRLRKYLNF